MKRKQFLNCLARLHPLSLSASSHCLRVGHAMNQTDTPLLWWQCPLSLQFACELLCLRPTPAPSRAALIWSGGCDLDLVVPGGLCSTLAIPFCRPLILAAYYHPRRRIARLAVMVSHPLLHSLPPSGLDDRHMILVLVSCLLFRARHADRGHRPPRHRSCRHLQAP